MYTCQWNYNINGKEVDDAAIEVEERDKALILKNCAQFSKCINKINNTRVNDANKIDINVVIPMYNLIEFGDSYLKTSGRLWQYLRDELNATLKSSESFKLKVKITA